MKLPNRKITNYVEQKLNGELLIYNLSTNQAFCLNATSAKVFSACDGAMTVNELEQISGFSGDLIYLALDELQKSGLLETEQSPSLSALNRRELVRRIGFASMIALPVVSSLVAPTAASAQSGCVNPGGFAPGTSTGIRSATACANDAFRCCSNMTIYNGTSNQCQVINNITGTVGCPCTCS